MSEWTKPLTINGYDAAISVSSDGAVWSPLSARCLNGVEITGTLTWDSWGRAIVEGLALGIRVPVRLPRVRVRRGARKRHRKALKRRGVL